MAGKKLAANVKVGQDLYRVGDTPPKDVADQITNPKAWGEDDKKSSSSKSSSDDA